MEYKFNLQKKLECLVPLFRRLFFNSRGSSKPERTTDQRWEKALTRNTENNCNNNETEKERVVRIFDSLGERRWGVTQSEKD